MDHRRCRQLATLSADHSLPPSTRDALQVRARGMARTPNSLRPRASSTTTLADPSSNVGHAPYAISRSAKITLSEGTTPRRLSGASSSERAIAQLRRLARHRPSRVLLLAATMTQNLRRYAPDAPTRTRSLKPPWQGLLVRSVTARFRSVTHPPRAATSPRAPAGPARARVFSRASPSLPPALSSRRSRAARPRGSPSTRARPRRRAVARRSPPRRDRIDRHRGAIDPRAARRCAASPRPRGAASLGYSSR